MSVSNKKPTTKKESPAIIAEDFDEVNLITLKAEKCKRSLYAFLVEFWSEISPTAFVYSDHIPFVCSQLENIGKRILANEKVDRDLVLNQPPGTSKSICLIMLRAWLWANDPKITIISSSYASAISIDSSTKCRQVVNSDKYKLFFPWVSLKEDRQNKSDFHSTCNGSMYSTSTGSAVRGRHAILIIQDDPDDSESVESEVERQNAHDYISGTLSTRKQDNERTYLILCQQRLHSQDCTNFLINSNPDRYNHIVLPAEYDERIVKPASLKAMYERNGGLLDPVRLSLDTLRAKKLLMGSRAYGCQYNQNPLGEGSEVIKEGWFPIITQDDFNKLSANKHFTVDFYLDTAFTTDRKRNDPSCIMATTKIDNFLYILNVSRVWKEFPDLVRHIQQWTASNGHTPMSRIVIEPKASGLSTVQTLRQNTGLNIIEGVSLNKHSGNKKQRMSNISMVLEGERVILVKDIWNKPFLRECSDFTGAKGDTDDQLDCLWMAVVEKLVRKSTYGKYHCR